MRRLGYLQEGPEQTLSQGARTRTKMGLGSSRYRPQKVGKEGGGRAEGRGNRGLLGSLMRRAGRLAGKAGILLGEGLIIK